MSALIALLLVSLYNLTPSCSSCVVTDSENLPYLPYYLCQSCFNEFGDEDCVVHPHTNPREMDQ